MTRFVLLLALGSCLATTASAGEAQTVDRGLLTGLVTADGQPLDAAVVSATDLETGQEFATRTNAAGRFAFPLLAQAAYSVKVEKLGHRPAVVAQVPVLPGRSSIIEVQLRRAAPPVLAADTVWLPGGGRVAPPGGSRWFSDLEVRGLPHEDGSLQDLGRVTGVAGPRRGIQGLPQRLTGLAVDGFLHRPDVHPDFADDAPTPVLPLFFMEDAELALSPADGEWPGVHGPVLQGYSARGTTRATVRAMALFGGYDETTSLILDDDDAGRDDIQAGALIRGALIPDSALYSAGGWFRSSKLPAPPAYTDADIGAALSGTGDDLGVDLRRYGNAAQTNETAGSAFGRFDWRIGERHTLAVIGLAGLVRRDPEGGREGWRLQAMDRGSLLGGLSFGSTLSDRVHNQLRIAVDLTQDEISRDESVDGGRIVPSWIVDGRVALGADPRLPGTFDQWTLNVDESLQYQAGTHRFEFGGGINVASYDHTYTHGSLGAYTFGGVDQLGSREGAFTQTTGALPVADFGITRLSLLLQDRWTPVPGFVLLLGVRGTHERLPRDEVSPTVEWTTLSGVSNTAFDDAQTYLSPHYGFMWNVRNEFRWMVHGGGASIQEGVESWPIGEALAHDSGVLTRRGFGSFPAWPAAPDPAAALTIGPRLTILDAEFEAPRTNRFSLGVTRALGPGTTLHLDGVYRETSQLPVRRDINLVPISIGNDQHGRPLYGILTKSGGLVAAEPGSNRRFREFDAVYLLSSAGSNEYWGLTVGLENRTADLLDVYASYTFSGTRDDVPGLRGSLWGPSEGMSPFPEGAFQGWESSESDYDSPHRFALAARIRASGRVQPALSVLYRFASGPPFTPGLPAGVDVNGDGGITNDPAFVDDAMEGMADLMGGWDCLRSQVASFASRNSCRADSRQTLTVRGTLGFEGRSFGGGIFLEALGLLDDRAGPIDTALYTVNPDAPLLRDAAGNVTIPLMVNPRFGEPLHDFTVGPEVRIGLFLRY